MHDRPGNRPFLFMEGKEQDDNETEAANSETKNQDA